MEIYPPRRNPQPYLDFMPGTRKLSLLKISKNFTPAKPPTGRRTATTQRRYAVEWESHKDFIRERYVEYKDTPDELLKCLAERSFEVSRPQLQHKLKDWGFRQKGAFRNRERWSKTEGHSDQINTKNEKMASQSNGAEWDSETIQCIFRRHKVELDKEQNIASSDPLEGTTILLMSDAASGADSMPQDLSDEVTAQYQVGSRIGTEVSCKTYPDADGGENTHPSLNTATSTKVILSSVDKAIEALTKLMERGSTITYGAVEGCLNGGIHLKMPAPCRCADQENTFLLENSGQSSTNDLISFETYQIANEPVCRRCSNIKSQKDSELTLEILEKDMLATLSRNQVILGSEHLLNLRIAYGLGAVSFCQSKHSAALVYFKRAYAGYKTLLGRKHFYTLESLCSIGLVLVKLERYPEAVRYYMHALDGYLKTIGDCQKQIWKLAGDIAHAHDLSGNFTEAIKWYKRSLLRQRRVLGDEHLFTMVTTNNVGFAYMRKGSYQEALGWFKVAINGSKKALGVKHQLTISFASNIATTLALLGRYNAATRWYEQILALEKEVFGDEHPRALKTEAELECIDRWMQRKIYE